MTVELDDVMIEEAAAEADKISGSKGKRLSPEDWEEIVRHRERNTMLAREICEKYGISNSGLHAMLKRLKAAGLFSGHRSKEKLYADEIALAKAKATAVTLEKKEDFNSKKSVRIERTRESTYTIADVIKALNNNVLKEIVNSAGKIKPGDMLADFKALRVAAAVNREAWETQAETLEISKEISEAAIAILQVEDLSDDEIAEMQKRSEGDEEDDGEIIDVPAVPE